MDWVPCVSLNSAITTSKRSNHKYGLRRAGRKWEEAARDWRILARMKAECVGEKASGKVATGTVRCEKVYGSGSPTTAYNLNRTTRALKPRSKQKSTPSSTGPTAGNQNRMTTRCKASSTSGSLFNRVEPLALTSKSVNFDSLRHRGQASLHAAKTNVEIIIRGSSEYPHVNGSFVFRFLFLRSDKFYLASNSIVEQRMLADGGVE
jgi:hypothetical protein